MSDLYEYEIAGQRIKLPWHPDDFREALGVLSCYLAETRTGDSYPKSPEESFTRALLCLSHLTDRRYEREVLEPMREALEEAREALDHYSDVNDGADGQPSPNRAMSAMGMIDETLGRVR